MVSLSRDTLEVMDDIRPKLLFLAGFPARPQISTIRLGNIMTPVSTGLVSLVLRPTPALLLDRSCGAASSQRHDLGVLSWLVRPGWSPLLKCDGYCPYRPFNGWHDASRALDLDKGRDGCVPSSRPLRTCGRQTWTYSWPVACALVLSWLRNVWYGGLASPSCRLPGSQFLAVLQLCGGRFLGSHARKHAGHSAITFLHGSEPLQREYADGFHANGMEYILMNSVDPKDLQTVQSHAVHFPAAAKACICIRSIISIHRSKQYPSW